MTLLLCSTLLPSTVRTEIRLSPSRVTSALLPSGMNATPLGPEVASPSWTLPAGVSVLPQTVNTDTVPSERLATSTRLPAGLMATPAAPGARLHVATTAGGLALRSITEPLLSGAVFFGSAGSTLVAAVTMARPRPAHRDAGGRADHAGRRLDLADDLGRRHADVDDGDGVGRRVGRHGVDAVDQHGLVVVGGDRDPRMG